MCVFLFLHEADGGHPVRRSGASASCCGAVLAGFARRVVNGQASERALASRRRVFPFRVPFWGFKGQLHDTPAAYDAGTSQQLDLEAGNAPGITLR